MQSKWAGWLLSVWLIYPPAIWADKLTDLIERAAHGDAVAQTDLGTKYALSSGVAHDYNLAQRWFIAAAKQGNPLAQYNLGF